MKNRKLIILMLVAAMLLTSFTGCTLPTGSLNPSAESQAPAAEAPEAPPAEEAPQEAPVQEVESLPEEAAPPVGDLYRFHALADGENGANGLTFYATSDGKTLTALETLGLRKGTYVMPDLKDGSWGEAGNEKGKQVVMGYQIPVTGAIQLFTRTKLLSGTGTDGYTVKIAQGTPDNIVGKHQVLGYNGTDYRYGYGLKVTEGEMLYVIYEPKNAEAFLFDNFLFYTALGENVAVMEPVNQPLLLAEQSYKREIRFTDLVGENNGMNGLTFYYTADGKSLTPLSSYDKAEGKWYKGTDGVLVYPCQVKKDNYGLFGSSASEYIVMGYKLPATGAINLFTWAALQGDGVDYRVMVARGTPDNIVTSFDVTGSAQTVDYRNTKLDVKRGDVIYIHYKPLEAVNGGWGGYNTVVTYESGGWDYQVFDPNGIEAPEGLGETIPFTTLVEEGKNGANNLTFYYTADGKDLTAFTDYEAKEGKWYHGGEGALIYPSNIPEDNYGLVGSSASEYVAIGYEVDRKGTVELYTWMALQSGHDYQVRVAKGTPDNILYTMDVKGESQTVEEQTVTLNVDKGDNIYVLYKPLEVENGAWGGYKLQLTWTAVGEHVGPEDPETIVPEDMTDGIHAGDIVRFSQLAEADKNGANDLTFYYTADGKTLKPFSQWDAAEKAWWEATNNAICKFHPQADMQENYGVVQASSYNYGAIGYKVPETGTIDLYTWFALQSGHDYQLRIAKGTPDNILYTYDVKGESQTIQEQTTTLNVTKGEEIYLLFKSTEAGNDAWGGYKAQITWKSVGKQTGPADPDKIVPDDTKPAPEPPAAEVVKFADIASLEKNGENGLTMYYTADGKTLKAYTLLDANAGAWYEVTREKVSKFHPRETVKDNYGVTQTTTHNYTVMGYEVPKTGTIDLYSWFVLQSGHDFQVRIAKGTVDNILYTYDVKGESQKTAEKTVTLNVTKGDEIFLIYKPLEVADDAWGGYKTQITWVSEGTQTGPADPDKIVPDDLKPAPENPDPEPEPEVVKFAEIASVEAGKNGENGLTFYYTADGKTYTPFSLLDTNDKAWYEVTSNEVSKILPKVDEADNYGLAQTSSHKYVAMSYQVDKTGTVKLDTDFVPRAAMGYEIRIAKGTPDNILYRYNTAETAGTVTNHETTLNVAKDDVIYIIYRPKTMTAVTHFNYWNELTWVSVGEQTGPADPDKIIPDDLKEPVTPTYSVAVGDVVNFAQIASVEENGNGANGLTFYYTADGKTYTAYSGMDLTGGDTPRWADNTDSQYNMIEPKNNEGANYGLTQTSAAKYTAIGYKVPETGTIDLWSWFALQGNGNDYQVRIAKGTPDNILYTMNVRGESQTVQEKTFAVNVDKGEEIFLIFRPIEVADGAWAGYKAAITWTSVGKYNDGVTNPEARSPEQLDALLVPVQFAQIASVAENGNGTNGLSFGYTDSHSKIFIPYTKVDSVDGGRWHNGNADTDDMIGPKNGEAANYGITRTIEGKYPVLKYEVPETGTIDLYTWLALQTDNDYQLRIAKGTVDNILYTMDVTGNSQTIKEQTVPLNVTKGDAIYLIFRPTENDAAWCGYKAQITWKSVGEQTGPADPGKIVPDDLKEHSFSPWTAEGENHVRSCSCGEKETEAHAGGTATCTKKAKCAACGADYGELSSTHNYTGAEWVKEADKHFKNCVECGSAPTEEGAHSFDAGQITTAPTHVNKGAKIYTCTVCGRTKTEILDETTDHAYGDWVSGEDGKHTKTCECGDSVSEAHTYGDTLEKVDDAQHRKTCVCGHSITEGHTYGDWTSADGKHTRACACGAVESGDHTIIWATLDESNHSGTCAVCNTQVQENHSFTVTYDPEPTYVAAGKKTSLCSVCQYSKTEDAAKDVKFAEAASLETNGANNLTFGYTTGADFTPYAGMDTTQGRWNTTIDGHYNMIAPKQVEADNYGLIMTSATHYVAVRYKVPVKGTIVLNSELILQGDGRDYQVRIAKGNINSIVDHYTVTGLAGASGSKSVTMNVEADEEIFVIYKPISAVDGAWAGYKTQITWKSVGTQTGANNPTVTTPGALDAAWTFDQSIQGKTYLMANMAPTDKVANGSNGMSVYYTTTGSDLNVFPFYYEVNSGRWAYTSNNIYRAFIDPFANTSANYGMVGTSSHAYVVMAYKMPEYGTISLTNWVANNCNYMCELKIAKGTVSNVVRTYTENNAAGWIKTDSLNVEKDEMVYVIYRAVDANENAEQCWFGYKTEYTYTAVG